MKLEGIHHITAITGDAPGNVEFYTGVLGLRMVKKTVNQDDPTVYHLFYGDDDGSPGIDLTFFEYPGAARGRPGAGMVHRIVWRVGSAAVAASSGRSAWSAHGVGRRARRREPRVRRSRGPRARARAGVGHRRAAARDIAGDSRRARAAGLRRGARVQRRSRARAPACCSTALGFTTSDGARLGGARRAARQLLRLRPRAAGGGRQPGRRNRSPRRLRVVERRTTRAGARARRRRARTRRR